MKRLTALTLALALAAAIAGCGAKTADPATSDDDDDDGGTPADLQPVVSAAASIVSGSAPLEVAFTGVAAGGDGSLEYFWDFGDGETSLEQNPIHTFTASGVFSAVFTATDADGDFAAATVVVTVGNASLPVVSIAANPTNGPAPLDVGFTATASGGNAPLSFAWEFGDGALASVAAPAHTYMQEGTYLARVEVTDADGDVAEASVTIVVGATPQNNMGADLEIFNLGSYESGLEDNYEPNDLRASAYYLGDYGAGNATYTVTDAYVDAVEVTYYVDVVNYGDDATTPFYVDFYSDRASAPTATDIGDQYATVAELPSLTSKRLYFSLTSPVDGALAYAFADTLDQIEETDEANNASMPSQTSAEADEDWFYVYETANYQISVTLDQLPADYDVEIYDAGGTKVASSLNAGTTAESIQYTPTVTGDYFIRIFGYNGATSSGTAYRLSVIVE